MKLPTSVYALVALTAVLSSCVRSQGLHFQGNSPKNPPAGNVASKNVAKLLKRQYAWLHDRAWMSEQWNGDEKPFKSIRSDVDADLASGTNHAVLLMKYKTLSEKKPADPKALFRWGYAAYEAATQVGNSDQNGANQLTEVKQLFPFVQSPHAYEYARLRFLIQSYGYASKNLTSVGSRLLGVSPNDYDVKYNYIRCLTDVPDQTNQLKALALAQTLVKQRPDSPSVYGLLASVYYTLWATSGSKVYATEAIGTYQQYLQRAPGNYELRKIAEANIKLLQRMAFTKN